MDLDRRLRYSIGAMVSFAISPLIRRGLRLLPRLRPTRRRAVALVLGAFGALAASIGPLDAFLVLAIPGLLASLLLLVRILLHRKSRPVVISSAPAVSWTSWAKSSASRQDLRTLCAEPGTAVLGSIDADGRLLSRFDCLPDFEPVEESSFLERERFDLELVVYNGKVGLRKNFRGQRSSFWREVEILSYLGKRDLAPSLLAVNEAQTILIRSFVAGQVLNDLLVENGAAIRWADTITDPFLLKLHADDRVEKILERGRITIRSCLSERQLDGLRGEMESLHAMGLTGFSLTYGNVVLAGDGGFRFIDFDKATLHRGRGLAFRLARDHDRRLFQRLYGCPLITEGTVANCLARIPSTYSPVHLGQGVTTRGSWSVDSGTGRWVYLNGPALKGLLSGKRVLDLGAHTALMALLMLRDGAASVTAVELDAACVSAARELQRIFEWRYLRPFDLSVIEGDMLSCLRAAEPCDIVTALCSLYYLTAEEMAEAVERASRLAPVMVLQAKTDTRSEAAAGKAEKSAREYLGRLLSQHGYPEVEVFAPRGYTRPLLVGRRPT